MHLIIYKYLLQNIIVIFSIVEIILSNPDARRLYDDMVSGYNKLVRPVRYENQTVTIRMGLKLARIIDLNIKHQILTTNMWVKQEWTDPQLVWDPDEYGGTKELHIPAEQIWIPDIVLYNNADGSYELTIMTKAMIRYDGKVTWRPPAVFKSFCQIDIQNFPFDTQICHFKFGSWSHSMPYVDLRHIYEEENGENIKNGIELDEYYLNVEWDVINVSAKRNVYSYSCCQEKSFIDLHFNITMRRKSLFYTVNLIIPCFGLSTMSILVFYLPSDSREKVSLSVSIFVSLTFFLLVLMETMPSTSIAMPLFGKYICFTMILVAFSVAITITVLNVHFRSPSTHTMPHWIKKVFLHILPKYLLMKPPQYPLISNYAEDANNHSKHGKQGKSNDSNNHKNTKLDKLCQTLSLYVYSSPPRAHNLLINELDSSPDGMDTSDTLFKCYPRVIERSIINTMFIAQHIDNYDEYNSIREDWKYVSMVLDRIFLIVFTLVCIIGTVGIFIQAPILYDESKPIDVEQSLIAKQLNSIAAISSIKS